MESPAGSVSRWGAAPRAEGPGLRCPKCGEANSETARFCQQCAASLVEDPPLPEPAASHAPRADRIATAVACEVSGTTMSGDELAPAASRRPLDHARTILERHGGRVAELQDGPNAVVAVFGPHSTRGDGTLRAVRAAEEIRAAVSQAGADGIEVFVRLGVGTWELTSDDPNAGAHSTRRAVDLAIRLQRLAGPGEVLVAEDVHRLIGDEVAVEPMDRRVRLDAGEGVGPLRLVSVASVEPVAPSVEPFEPVASLEPVESDQPVESFEAAENVESIASVEPPAPATPMLSALPGPGMAPLSGRDGERAQLREAFERTVSGPRAELLAVMGEAGVGKTRLVEDLLGRLRGEASVLRVRCRPGQEGGETWPLADLVEQATAIADSDTPDEVRIKIRALFEAGENDSPVIRWMAHQVGLTGGSTSSTSPDQTVWAVRRLLEALSRRGPLVLFFDDADRAEPGFLRLLRDVGERVRELPVLLIFTGMGMPSGAPATDEAGAATVIWLHALAEAEIGSLANHVLGGDVDPEVRAVVATASAGNPLVAEQMLAMLVEDGLIRWEQGRWSSTMDLSAPRTAPSIEKVLEARLRGLSFEEAAVVGVAAVVGETFPGVRLAGLLPASAQAATGDHLEALFRKSLIRPVADSEDTFGFAHALIREVAARGISDETTAEVHERYARWLEQAAGDRLHRYAEILGSHLESASRIRIALEIDDHETRELVEGATSLLATAGARAAELGDAEAAFSLYDRAASLAPIDGRDRLELLLEMALALVDLGDPRSDAVLAKATDAARASADRTVEWYARVLSATIKARTATDLEALEAARTAAGKAFDVFRDLGDDQGLAWAWSLQGYLQWRRGRIAAATAAAEWAAEHAQRVGKAREEQTAVADVARAILYGPSSTDQAAGRCRELHERLRSNRRGKQEVASALALLKARRGRFEEARELVTESVQALQSLGSIEGAAAALVRSGLVESLAGDPAKAEQAMREALELVGRESSSGVRGQAAAFLADLVAERGDTEDALELAGVSEQAATLEDHVAQVGWRKARAKALARLGQREEADALARAAVLMAEQTDSFELRGEALMSLAEVLRLIGRTNEALPFAAKSLRVFQRGGATVAASKAQALLERLGARTSTRTPLPPSTATASGNRDAQHEPGPGGVGGHPLPGPDPQPGGGRPSLP